jgi:hypothetical protein
MDQEEAARAYDRAAIEHNGPSCAINFPIEDYMNPGQLLGALAGANLDQLSAAAEEMAAGNVGGNEGTAGGLEDRGEEHLRVSLCKLLYLFTVFASSS